MYSNEGVKQIVNYNHKNGDIIIVWGHSLGADSTLEAYGKGLKEPIFIIFFKFEDELLIAIQIVLLLFYLYFLVVYYLVWRKK